jgi:TolB-like protein/DNA-binding SARP family transcriptional activator
MQAFTTLVILGFPLAVILAWAFEMTPGGIKRETAVDPGESVTKQTGRKLDFLIIGVLAIGIIYFAVDKFVLEQAEVTAESVAREKSIAVLPFVNMSSDPEQEYFSDGLSEEILNLLAKIHDLKVIGRTSSFAFKGKNQDLREIGEALGVNTVLEGSVRKSGVRVRVTAQLIDVSDGSHIWSETYDRTLTDIFAVQDDVASAIIEALQIHVGAAPARGRPTESSEAYTFFLSARAALNRLDPLDARRSAQKAVELDPMFSEAYELLALAYWLSGNTIDSKEAQRGVNDAAAKALAIDPSLFFSQAMLSESEAGRTWSSSMETLDRMVREQPNHLALLNVLSWNLQSAGYFKEALSITERWVELDPLSPVAHLNLFYSRLSAGKMGEALESLKTVEQLGLPYASLTFALFHLSEKQDEAAIESLEAYFRSSGLPTDFAQELIVGARDPETGQALLDQLIPQIVASRPDDRSALETRIDLIPLYSVFGFLDRYFELLFELGISTSGWDDAELPVHESTVDRRTGFTAHPRYLEIAKTWELIELWDQRGAPDHCEKLDGQWVCE